MPWFIQFKINISQGFYYPLKGYLPLELLIGDKQKLLEPNTTQMNTRVYSCLKENSC